MQEPCHDYNQRCGQELCSKLALPPHLEIGREVDNLHHEVFPINIDPTPEVVDAARQQITAVGRWQVVSKEVQHSDDDVELARHSQVEQVAEDDFQNYCRGY